MKISLILDPNCIFQFYKNYFYIHPILRRWIDFIKMQKNIEACHLYLLSHESGSAFIEICPKLILPIDKLFFDLLSPTAYQYIKKLWNNVIPFAYMSPDATIGISQFRGEEYQPSADEIIVITNDEIISSFFKRKNITAVKLNTADFPIIAWRDIKNKFIDPSDITDRNDLEVYCDFDGTLFDVRNYSLYLAIHEYLSNDIESSSRHSDLVKLMENADNFHLINEKTVEFLQRLKNYPTYLLTQRKYEIDKTQPNFSCAAKLVEFINKNNQLNIQSGKQSFLNAIDQLDSKKSFDKKIEHIYYAMSKRAKNLTAHPHQIIFIDDNLIEHAIAEKSKPYFSNMGIKIIPVLIVNPMYYSEKILKIIEKYLPDMHDILSEIVFKEQNKIESAMHAIMNKQEKMFNAYNRYFLFTSDNVNKEHNVYLQNNKELVLSNVKLG